MAKATQRTAYEAAAATKVNHCITERRGRPSIQRLRKKKGDKSKAVP